MSIPTAKAIAIVQLPQGRLATVRCPYCRREHRHGLPADVGQHRQAHCWEPKHQAVNGAGYIIEIPEYLENQK